MWFRGQEEGRAEEELPADRNANGVEQDPIKDSSLHRGLDQLEDDPRKFVVRAIQSVVTQRAFHSPCLGRFSESFEMLAPPEDERAEEEGSGYSTADDISVDLEGMEGYLGSVGGKPVAAMESSGRLDEVEDTFDGESSDIERVSLDHEWIRLWTSPLIDSVSG